MEAAAIIAISIVVVGIVLYVHHRLCYGDTNVKAAADEVANADGEAKAEECCGLHIVCEKDSLLSALSPEIIYYDDEELDEFAGRQADDYSNDEIEMFRDVLLTLQPTDIAGWARSIQKRGITLPSDVRDELLMIVSENRKEAVK